MKVAGVIPARWGSTRFPGKSLALIAGKPLVQWVWTRASQAIRLSSLVVATDDPRIQSAVQSFGGQVVMTRPDHPSGTDRMAEAIQGLDCEAAINIQGDEPLVDPALIDQLAEIMADPEADWDMATAAEPIQDEALLVSPSVVKVVCGQDGRALYFSRAVIPHVREKDGVPSMDGVYLRHVGLYAYRRAFLERLVRTPPTMLEEAEKLEQLRALHLGAKIKVVITNAPALGVDEPQDVATAEAALLKFGLRS